jgi:hypothetical protein
MAANQQLSIPVTRLVLRGIALIATFYSAFFGAGGLLMTMQFLDDEIPAGKVQAIIGHIKGGTPLRLDNGREVVLLGPGFA